MRGKMKIFAGLATVVFMSQVLGLYFYTHLDQLHLITAWVQGLFSSKATCPDPERYPAPQHFLYHDNDRPGARHLAIVMVGSYDFCPGSLLQRAVTLSVDNKRTYAAIHGYDLHIEAQLDLSRHAAWSKISALERYLSPPYAYDWVWWLDMDTVIMDLDQTLEPLVGIFDHRDDASKIHMVASIDQGGMNTGSVFFRASEWSRSYLKAVRQEKYLLGDSNYEQSIMYKLYASAEVDYRRHIAFLPQPWINAFDYLYKPGDFLIHFAGYREDWPERFMARWKQLSKKTV